MSFVRFLALDLQGNSVPCGEQHFPQRIVGKNVVANMLCVVPDENNLKAGAHTGKVTIPNKNHIRRAPAGSSVWDYSINSTNDQTSNPADPYRTSRIGGLEAAGIHS